MADSAEQGNSDDNPFSFKSFVKSKKDAKTPRRKQNKTNQNNERSPSSRRKKDIFEEEVPFPDVNEYEIIKNDVDGGNNKPDINPFSYKHFLPDDMASRNKRVLQIIDDEVHEVKTTAADTQLNGENDQSAVEVDEFTVTNANTSETDSETESEDTPSTAMSGSVHYFVAPLDSSKAQAMVIEEVNQLKDENEKLRRHLQDSNQAKEEEKKRVASLQRKLARIEKREADETAALENMVQMVEKNLELTTQRALRAEATIAKLKEELTILKTESVPIATYNQLLEANRSTMTAVRDKSRAASDQMNAAAKNAEQAIRQLASGADTLKFISQQLEFIDRITDVHVPEDDT